MVGRRRRLGWLGPAIVMIGVAVALLGLWLVIAGRANPGAVIDTIAIDSQTSLVVRAEEGGDRNFVELHVRTGDEDKLVWQALVPPYGGRPGASGIAWSNKAVTVRVIRNGRAEIFALAAHDASKLGGFKLAPGKTAVVKQTAGPVTLTDHVRSYEIVEGRDWHQLVAIDLATGEGLWKQDLGPAPIEDAGIEGGTVWIRQPSSKRGFRVLDGSEESIRVRSPNPS